MPSRVISGVFELGFAHGSATSGGPRDRDAVDVFGMRRRAPAAGEKQAERRCGYERSRGRHCSAPRSQDLDFRMRFRFCGRYPGVDPTRRLSLEEAPWQTDCDSTFGTSPHFVGTRGQGLQLSTSAAAPSLYLQLQGAGALFFEPGGAPTRHGESHPATTSCGGFPSPDRCERGRHQSVDAKGSARSHYDTKGDTAATDDDRSPHPSNATGPVNPRLELQQPRRGSRPGDRRLVIFAGRGTAEQRRGPGQLIERGRRNYGTSSFSAPGSGIGSGSGDTWGFALSTTRPGRPEWRGLPSLGRALSPS